MGSIKTPHAAVIVWNYKDRLGSEETSGSKLHEVEPTIFSTVSCISIKTAKTKSQPNGSFEIRLAPTKNWVTVLSPGSWLAILMSQQKIEYKDIAHKADPNKVKMLGRIESVRAHVTVDQVTGARHTEYIVQGSDWASIFNTAVYIDPLMRDLGENDMWTSWKLLYEKYALNSLKDGLPTPDGNLKVLMGLWGSESDIASNTQTSALGAAGSLLEQATTSLPSIDAIKLDTATVLKVPSEVARYFSFNGTALMNIVKKGDGYQGIAKYSGRKHVDIENGSTIYYDKYSSVTDEAVGIVMPNSIFGTNSLWQLLVDNSNNTLTELIPEIRWTASGKAELALYRRIRPFVFRKDFEGYDKVQKYTANMYDVRTVSIPSDEIFAVDAGTNWRDKINFVEVLPHQSVIDEGFVYPHESKLQSQTFDENAFNREGFRPIMEKTKYMVPKGEGTFDPLETAKWKYLLREWHFNNHLLLNGNIVFVGQNNYIQVGDNIMFDENVVTTSNNTNIDALTLKKQNPKILAHVESVSHSFTVDSKGARSFITTVSFVRGIVVGPDRRPLNAYRVSNEAAEGRVDKNTRSLPPIDDLNKKDVFGTSTVTDPDKDKLKGS